MATTTRPIRSPLAIQSPSSSVLKFCWCTERRGCTAAFLGSNHNTLPKQVTLHAWHVQTSPPSVPSGGTAALFVHPYSKFGGCGDLMLPMATALASRGLPAICVDMRGAGRSTASGTWFYSAELYDVISAIDYAVNVLGYQRVVLVGSSAGAALTGSVLAFLYEQSQTVQPPRNVSRLHPVNPASTPTEPEVTCLPTQLHSAVCAWIAIGYPCGFMASFIFGRLRKDLVCSEAVLADVDAALPDAVCFIHGTSDEFSSIKQVKSSFSELLSFTEVRASEPPADSEDLDVDLAKLRDVLQDCYDCGSVEKRKSPLVVVPRGNHFAPETRHPELVASVIAAVSTFRRK